MPRIRVLPPLAVLALVGCSAPALKNFSSGPNDDPSTSSSSTVDTSSTDPGIGSVSSISASGSDSAGESSSDSESTGGSAGSTADGSSAGTSEGPGTSSGDAPAVCGDGVVAGEEECDDGNDDDADRCADDCTKNRWVFVSAATDHNGDMGGIEAVDGRCRQYALQSGRADDSWMTFIAWISDADHDVRDRLYPGKGRYVRTDGEVVVESVEDFFSGMLAAPINVDEHGQMALGGVITGTMPDGTAAPGTHCDNWTSASILDFSRYTGSADATDAWWTMDQNPDTNPNGCGSFGNRLYCIEGE